MTDWLQTVKEKHAQSFAMRGLPTKSEEHWKYTDVAWVENFLQQQPIASKQIDGAQIKTTQPLPKEVILCSIQEALIKHANLIRPYLAKEYNAERFPFAALNAAQMTNGIFLFVPKNCVIKTPIQLLFCNSYTTYMRNIFVVDSGSQCVVLEEYVSNSTEKYLTNVVNHVYLENNAMLNYYKIQDENIAAAHIANMFVEQKQDSVFKSFNLTCGAIFSRDDVHVSLNKKGASCYLTGLYQLMYDNQYVDNHLQIDHLAPQGHSSMVYKGILDKKSRAVFNGKVFIKQDAQQIDAHQANHNLLLSDNSEVNTKPELEIYADNVKCTHGATIGQLDAEALFYLRSRGLSYGAAQRMLVEAFAAEIFNAVTDDVVLQHIKSRVSA